MPTESRVLHGVAARFEPRRLVAGALTVVVVAMAGWWLVRPPSTPIDATLAVATTAGGSRSGRGASANESGAGGAGATSGGLRTGDQSETEIIVVQAAGAVASPGVYKVPAGSRVSDLITLAGGAIAEGDPNALNLAGQLRDGDRVEVPRIGEVPAAPSSGGTASVGGSPRVVDLNRGTAEDLDGLPGIGPSTAAAIITYRDQHGAFGSVDDLLDVPGIGPAKLEAIRDLVDV